MQTVSLNGKWSLSEAGKKGRMPARVPGCVHLDLMKAKKIPDPYYRDQEADVQWVGERSWHYERDFDVSGSLLKREHVLLRCEGLDTLATVKINGETVGETDNMFRAYEFDVKPLLKKGNNKIEVLFHSVIEYIAKRQEEHPIPGWFGTIRIPGGNWVRKEQCNFGWDWGPKAATCGIWRDIELIGFDGARITDVHVLQDHSPRGAVKLTVHVKSGPGAAGEVRVVARLKGKRVAETAASVDAGSSSAELSIKEPQLWWPNGLGDQPLYEITAELLQDGKAIDKQVKRVGLRTLELVQKVDEDGSGFWFEANGTAFFAKGANWIPADTFDGRLTTKDYERLIADAAAANMNMLRVWGGGIYERDEFYDLCDEHGICIWQDFMFACSTYPTFDDAYMSTVEDEIRDNVRRIRHHPCLALWCGNNELEQGLVGDEWTERQMSWDDYCKLFDVLIPNVVKELDPQTPYWPSSPHTPLGDRRDFRSDHSGDAHTWAVWHGREPFEWYLSSKHRFVSEFGFQSFPEPRTVQSFTKKEDRNVTSYVMEHHQRSWKGNTLMLTQMSDWFRIPGNFDSLLWVSQILQGLGIKYGVEHWRRIMPRCMGTLYWQLNDCWPVASWASIDFPGRWKALHYMARRFFAPVLISALEEDESGLVDVTVSSDEKESREGTVTWELTDLDGKIVAQRSKDVKITKGKSQKVMQLDLREHLEAHGRRQLLLWVELRSGRKLLSSNMIFFARPKHLDLPDPKLKTSVKALKGGAYRVKIKASRPALWVWLELDGADARFSDRFFHIKRNEEVSVTVTPEKKMNAADVRKKLRVRSLVDTY